MARCKSISTSETNVSVVFSRACSRLLDAGEVLAGVAAAGNPRGAGSARFRVTFCSATTVSHKTRMEFNKNNSSSVIAIDRRHEIMSRGPVTSARVASDSIASQLHRRRRCSRQLLHQRFNDNRICKPFSPPSRHLATRDARAVNNCG